MFSLIISIISIALVAALAAATVYFGGAAFNKGAAGADASAFINAGQQIAGAFTLADTDGSDSETLADLSVADNNNNIYLSQTPTYKGTALTLDANGYISVAVTDSVCIEIAKKVDPSIADIGAVEEDVAATGLFGCHVNTSANTVVPTAAADTNIAFYKAK